MTTPKPGQPVPASALANIPRLVTAYFAGKPDPDDPEPDPDFGEPDDELPSAPDFLSLLDDPESEPEPASEPPESDFPFDVDEPLSEPLGVLALMSGPLRLSVR